MITTQVLRVPWGCLQMLTSATTHDRQVSSQVKKKKWWQQRVRCVAHAWDLNRWFTKMMAVYFHLLIMRIINVYYIKWGTILMPLWHCPWTRLTFKETFDSPALVIWEDYRLLRCLDGGAPGLLTIHVERAPPWEAFPRGTYATKANWVFLL